MGRFCEIVYSIIDGHAKGSYPAKAHKPGNFVGACRKLESNTGIPRSFQILIPRALPALYEVRNNRGVGHVGGDVDPNHMDATLVVAVANWIMAELCRVLHNLSIDDAQRLVDSLAERRVPLVWRGANVRRVLDPKMKLKDQILLLMASSADTVSSDDLMKWCDSKNKSYFFKLLRKMHSNRLIEMATDGSSIEILPPGSERVSQLVTPQ